MSEVQRNFCGCIVENNQNNEDWRQGNFLGDYDRNLNDDGDLAEGIG